MIMLNFMELACLKAHIRVISSRNKLFGKFGKEDIWEFIINGFNYCSTLLNSVKIVFDFIALLLFSVLVQAFELIIHVSWNSLLNPLDKTR